MRKYIYSLRTTLTAAIALMVFISISLSVWMGLRASRDAYLELSSRDIEFMAEQLAQMVDPIAARSNSEADFARDAGALIRNVGEKYFAKYGMTGYATAWVNDGNYLYHPKVAPGVRATDSEQGKIFFEKAAAVDYNGIVHYMWQNKDEPAPREKFAAVKRIPSKPNWHVQITAYTQDDLLLPFQALQTKLTLMAVGIVLAAIVISIFLAGSLTRFLFRLQAILAGIAQGDLGSDYKELPVLAKRRDELGEMARNLSVMLSNLREIARNVTSGTAALLSASAGMNASAGTVSAASRATADGMAHVA
ncbi:MAG TPA: cache domain-containing protein, partial [Symbiobacteriaceae bacterium]|nr:cache domain-containing protein [Symbiobacteriaceae bacterium]